MRKFVLTAGIVLVLLGIYLVSEGPAMLVPVADMLGLSSHLENQTPLLAPTYVAMAAMNYTWISVPLDGGILIRGAFEGDEIDFYVMNSGNFSLLQAGHGAPAILLAVLSASQGNFTVTTPRADDYYFVFENQDTTRRVIVFTLDRVGETVLVHPAVENLPYGLTITGILLFALGLRGGRRKPSEPSDVAAAGWICRSCGADNRFEQAFCIKCGRSRQ